MSRFKRAPIGSGVDVPKERQLTFLDRVEQIRDAARSQDATEPALRLFLIVLALMGLGFVLQASHASTTQAPDAFWSNTFSQCLFRIAAVAALLLGFRLGPEGLRRHIPWMVVACLVALVLVYVPGVSAAKNGAHRWIKLPLGMTFQPSDVARIVLILWVADRCIRLGDGVRDFRTGVWPILRLGLTVFVLVLCETDLGGALLFLMCFLGTAWVGGARLRHVSGPLVGFGGAAALILVTCVSYVRHRIEMWLGSHSNDQVVRSAEAIASGDLFGNGLGHGLFRNAGVPYLESDYVFALVGEELGFLGMAIVIALVLGLLWYALRLVLSIRDRYAALSAFGLLLSVGLQSMVHMQVVTGLAPPKGMTLPFVSHGGTSLVVSSLAVGLALGAARPRKAEVVTEPTLALAGA